MPFCWKDSSPLLHLASFYATHHFLQEALLMLLYTWMNPGDLESPPDHCSSPQRGLRPHSHQGAMLSLGRTERICHKDVLSS